MAVDDVESSGAVLGFGSSSKAGEVAEGHLPEKQVCTGDDASKAVAAAKLAEFTGLGFDIGSQVVCEDDNLGGGGSCDASGVRVSHEWTGIFARFVGCDLGRPERVRKFFQRRVPL